MSIIKVTKISNKYSPSMGRKRNAYLGKSPVSSSTQIMGMQVLALQKWLGNAKAIEMFAGVNQGFNRRDGVFWPDTQKEHTLRIGQKRIDRLVSEVRSDHPGLPKTKDLKILAEPGVGIDGEADVHGIFDDINKIRIAYEGRDDYFIKGVIFHELAHLDEALHVAFGSKALWAAHEFWLDGGHDNWADQAGDDYTEWLRVRDRAPDLLESFRNPDINNAEWRP